MKHSLYSIYCLKKILLVRQFTFDNNVCFEFHFHYCLMKDCTIGTTLLLKETKEGLYHSQTKLGLVNAA